MRRPHHPDGGMTIIELLIAMMILTILIAPLATSFVIGLTTTQRTDQDVTNSADAQLLTLYFDSDVASSERVTTTNTCGGADTIVQFEWNDGSSSQLAAYRTSRDTAAETLLGAASVYRLERVLCSAPGNVVSSHLLARSLSMIPVVSCDGSACPASSTPRLVSLPLDQLGRTASDDRFTFTLTATRKVTP